MGGMHQVLKQDDILYLIFSYVAEYGFRSNLNAASSQNPRSGASTPYVTQFSPGHQERKALVRFALTCKAWEKTALDALWREIPTVEPLFGLFPVGCLILSHRHEGVFARHLVPSDWTRFNLYAPRVQRIGFSDARWAIRWTVDFKTFLSLSHFHPGGPILPNLRHWSWDTYRGTGDIVGGMCFLSSTVTSIDVILGHSTTVDTLFGFLYNLPLRCPQLETFSLAYNDRDWPDWGLDAVMTALQSIFSLLPHLKQLSLPFFMDTPPFIMDIGGIPKLTDLIISCPEKLIGHFIDEDTDDAIYPRVPSGSASLFENLTNVTLQSTMSSCFRFLHRFGSRNIINMSLTILHLRSATQLSQGVELVATCCPLLKTFYVQYTPAQHDTSFDYSYFLLKSLQRCSHLEELSIGHPRVAPWDDDDVLQAVRCWPNIRVLRLNPRPNRALTESKMTLRTLWNLVRWCKHLEVVRFYVDTSVIPTLNELAKADASSSISRSGSGAVTPLNGQEGQGSTTSYSAKNPLFPPGLGLDLDSSLNTEGLGSNAIGIKGSSTLALVDFGISQRTETSTQELATFIASLCPSAQVVGTETWKEVGVILKVNQATRREDQKKISDLKAEVEALRRLVAAAKLGNAPVIV